MTVLTSRIRSPKGQRSVACHRDSSENYRSLTSELQSSRLKLSLSPVLFRFGDPAQSRGRGPDFTGEAIMATRTWLAPKSVSPPSQSISCFRSQKFSGADVGGLPRKEPWLAFFRGELQSLVAVPWCSGRARISERCRGKRVQTVWGRRAYRRGMLLGSAGEPALVGPERSSRPSECKRKRPRPCASCPDPYRLYGTASRIKLTPVTGELPRIGPGSERGIAGVYIAAS